MKTTADIIKSIEKVYMRYSINKIGLFKYNQPIQNPNLPANTFLVDLTGWAISPCPNHSRARYKATNDSPYILEPVEIIQTSQS